MDGVRKRADPAHNNRAKPKAATAQIATVPLVGSKGFMPSAEVTVAAMREARESIELVHHTDRRGGTCSRRPTRPHGVGQCHNTVHLPVTFSA